MPTLHLVLGLVIDPPRGATILVRETARDFIGSYRDWIEPYLAEQEP